MSDCGLRCLGIELWVQGLWAWVFRYRTLGSGVKTVRDRGVKRMQGCTSRG
jgi:hypothetical protein